MAIVGLGCAAMVAAFVLLCGVAAFLIVTLLGPSLKSMMEQTQARHVAWEEVARFWRPPPADAGPDQLFPAQVDQFRRETHDARADIPELNIKAPGLHAAYRAGAQHIEVFAYRASPLEKEALFKRAFEVVGIRKDKSYDDFSTDSGEDKTKDQPRPSYRESSGSPEGTRLTYRLGPPDQRGILWWDKGWLFVVRTRSGADPETFLKLYLASLSSGPGAGGLVEKSR